MKIYKLTQKDLKLIEEAKKVIKRNYRNKGEVLSTVGASLESKSGKIYCGVNIESKTSAPTSICAETGAISNMLSNGEREIKTIVGLWIDGKKYGIMPPCGACRHIISQFGNPFVILDNNKKVKLNDLYPLK